LRPQLSCSVEVEGLLVRLERIPLRFPDRQPLRQIPQETKRFLERVSALFRTTSRDRAALEPTREIDSVQPPKRSISKTVDEVIVQHTNRLKVTDRHSSPHNTTQPKALYPKSATYE